MYFLSKFKKRTTKLGLGAPSLFTILAGVFLTCCEVANALFVNGPAMAVIATVIGAAAAYGVQPLFGPALTTLLHIPAQVLFFVSAGITGANGLVAALHMSTLAHTILGGALTLLGAVLFGSPLLAQAVSASEPVKINIDGAEGVVK